MNLAIPFNHLHETETILAFHDPRPRDQVQNLFVSQYTKENLSDLQPEGDDFLTIILCITQEVVKEHDLAALEYGIILNGSD